MDKKKQAQRGTSDGLDQGGLYWAEPIAMLLDGMQDNTPARSRLLDEPDQNHRARRRLERRIDPLHRPLQVRS